MTAVATHAHASGMFAAFEAADRGRGDADRGREVAHRHAARLAEPFECVAVDPKAITVSRIAPVLGPGSLEQMLHE
jgi:hypothetical protein